MGGKMPTISMFYGIIIRMYRKLGGKHNMPHIHVLYSGNERLASTNKFRAIENRTV